VAQPPPRLHHSDLHRPAPGPSTTPPAPESAGTGSASSQASFEWKKRCYWRFGIRDDAEPGIEHGVFGGYGGPGVRECRGVQGAGVEDHGGRREGQPLRLLPVAEAVGLAGRETTRGGFIRQVASYFRPND